MRVTPDAAASAAARSWTPTGRARRPTCVVARRPRRRGRRAASTRRAGDDACSTPRAAWSAPGCVDLHTHLREPGREEAETIETGTRAAALGGYTAVVAMPNTEPAARQRRGRRVRCCAPAAPSGLLRGRGRRAPSPSGRRASELAPMAEMAALGVRMFTDDGVGVQDAALMRRALEYATRPGRGARPSTARTSRWPAAARMHEGAWSSRLGLPGGPPSPRSVMVAARHRARRGSPARRCTSCTSRPPGRSSWCGGRKARACRSPPRSRRTTSSSPTRAAPATTRSSRSTRRCAPTSDVAALRAALADGTIDAIATDHAPHAPESKELPVRRGAAGHARAARRRSRLTARPSWSSRASSAARRARPCCRGSRPRIAGARGAQGGRGRGRAPRRTCASSTPAALGRRPRRRSPARSRNTPFAGRDAHRQGPPHRRCAASRS